MEVINDSSKRVHAMAKEGEPVDVRDGMVVLRFAHRFHAEQCSADTSQEMFGAALEQVLGRRARLSCVVEERGAPAPSVEEQESVAQQAAEQEAVAQAEEAELAGDVPDPQDEHRRAVELVERDLGGQVVDAGSAVGR